MRGWLFILFSNTILILVKTLFNSLIFQVTENLVCIAKLEDFIEMVWIEHRRVDFSIKKYFLIVCTYNYFILFLPPK